MRIPKFAYYLAKVAYKVLALRTIVLEKKSQRRLTKKIKISIFDNLNF